MNRYDKESRDTVIAICVVASAVTVFSLFVCLASIWLDRAMWGVL